jgi:hypothetical protein
MIVIAAALELDRNEIRERAAGVDTDANCAHVFVSSVRGGALILARL